MASQEQTFSESVFGKNFEILGEMKVSLARVTREMCCVRWEAAEGERGPGGGGKGPKGAWNGHAS